MRLFALAVVAALAIALRAPLATTVIGLIAFGVLHNVLELRYVTGRFATVLSGRFLWLLLGLISAIVLCRLAALFVGEPARVAEILVGYTVLAVACIQARSNAFSQSRATMPRARSRDSRAQRGATAGPAQPLPAGDPAEPSHAAEAAEPLHASGAAEPSNASEPLHVSGAPEPSHVSGAAEPLHVSGAGEPLHAAVPARGRAAARPAQPLLAALLAVLGLALAASLRWPAYHFVILAHLHNMVPLVFLWEWSRQLPTPAARRWFRTLQIGWVLVVPALILTGVTDPLIGGVTSKVAAFAGNPTPIMAASAPPAAVATTMGVRLLVVFAFLQTMHYFVWVYFLPRHAPDAAAAFAGRVPWLRGGRAWALGLGFGALLAVLLIVDYATGRALYASLASYHAYLEFPVLLILLLGMPAGSQVVFRESAPGCQPVPAVLN